jgi:aminoglycoside/choline kinase family phosphotransferase
MVLPQSFLSEVLLMGAGRVLKVQGILHRMGKQRPEER